MEVMEEHQWRTFLDLGCGDGSLLYAIESHGLFSGKEVYAIDLSMNHIARTKRINERFNCYVNDACKLSNIKDNSIDLLASNQVIEHIPNEDGMLKEIFRVLKNDGVVYLSTVYKTKYAWYFHRCNNKWTLDPTHVREYTEDRQLFDNIEKNGFKIIRSTKNRLKYPLLHSALRLMRYDYRLKDASPIVSMLEVPIFGYYIWDMVLRKRSDIPDRES